MTGMEHAIEQAARIIHGCTGDEDGAPVAARALAEAGLLAPEMKPSRLWRAISSEGEVWCESSNESEVRERARPGDTLQRLWVTPVCEQWCAEDDGRADR